MAEHNGQGSIALSEMQQACGVMEEMGFDVPFATFTWTHWQEAQACMLLGFGRFQRAVSSRQFQLAALIALEMQQVVTDMQKEVCSWLEPGTRG